MFTWKFPFLLLSFLTASVTLELNKPLSPLFAFSIKHSRKFGELIYGATKHNFNYIVI